MLSMLALVERSLAPKDVFVDSPRRKCLREAFEILGEILSRQNTQMAAVPSAKLRRKVCKWSS